MTNSFEESEMIDRIIRSSISQVEAIRVSIPEEIRENFDSELTKRYAVAGSLGSVAVDAASFKNETTQP